MMNKYQESGGYVPCPQRSGIPITQTILTAAARQCRVGTWAFAAVTAVMLGGWSAPSAWAGSMPPVTLAVTGPQTATAGKPLKGIKVRLRNPGLAVRDSRLRLTIHDGADRALGPDDIKVDVREGKSWQPVQVNAIDGGVIGAIGAAGKPHDELHQSGGFAIGANAKKAWQLRVRFRLPGHYSMVLTVSPDNGATQLAKPASYSVEVL